MASNSSQSERLSPRAILRRILMLDDTAHSIALGTAIGMFIGMTPTVGIQMVLVLCLAAATGRFFRFNKLAALLTVYISNPFTVLPIYWFNYCVGTWFVEATVTYDDFARMLEYEGFAQWWETVSGLFIQVGAPLIVGSLIVATVTSLPTYPLIHWLVTSARTESGPSSAAGSTTGKDTSTDETRSPAISETTSK